MNANTQHKLLVASLLTLSAGWVLATDFYWNASAPQPADWNDVGSWKTGGDSQWDPDATALPIPGVDRITFRNGDHSVRATGTATFGTLYLGDGGHPNAHVTFNGDFEADANAGFVEAKSGATFSLTGGALRFNDREFYANSPASLLFSGASVSGLKLLTFGKNASIGFSNGVKGSDIQVTLCPYDGSGSGNSVRVTGAGTVLDNLTLAGRYWGSTFRVDGGAVVTNLLVKYSDQYWTPDGGEWLESRFEFENATLENFNFNNFVFTQPPNTSFVFGPGTRVSSTWWDPFSLVSSNGLLRVAGAGTSYTNFSYRVVGRDARVEILDGAQAATRLFFLGYGTTGNRGVIAGEGTTWTLYPKDMKQEGVLLVGYADGSTPASDNTLVIEDGAKLEISDLESYKNGQYVNQLLGLQISSREGDNGNSVVVRSGAIVSNAFATAVGGGFTASSNARGGAFNLLRIEGEGTVYRGGTCYNDIWDSELYLGWETGCSNAVEVADGAVASFTGCAQFAVSTAGGGSRITVDNGELSIASKIDCGVATLAKGAPVLEVRGSNGVLRAAAIMQDAGWNGAEWTWDLRIGIPAEGRATDEACIALTGNYYDFNKDALIGCAVGKRTAQLTLDLDRAWTTSGRGHFATLLSMADGNSQFATGEQRYRYYENAFNAIAASIPADDLGNCRLSVVTDRANPDDPYSAATMVRLVIEAGTPPATQILVF